MDGMICVMMNLNKYAENFGERNVFIFVVIDLKRENKGDIVIVMDAKRVILNASLKRNRFD